MYTISNQPQQSSTKHICAPSSCSTADLAHRRMQQYIVFNGAARLRIERRCSSRFFAIHQQNASSPSRSPKPLVSIRTAAGGISAGFTAGLSAVALAFSSMAVNLAQRVASGASADSLCTIATCLAACAIPLILEEQPMPLHSLLPASALFAYICNNVLWGTAAAVFTIRVAHVIHSAVKPYAEADHTSMLQAIPPTASILSKGLDALLVESQPTNRLRTGCLLLVKPGEVVPLDGNVVWGSSTVDVPCRHKEMPKKLHRVKGDKVLAGCLNGGNSVLVIQATCCARETEAAQSAGLRNSMGRVVLPFELQTAAAGFMITDHKFEPTKQTAGRAVTSVLG